MSAALWLAARDVCVRWRRALLAAGVVAAIAAAGAAMELVARARERAVAARIDAIGPSLTVVAPEVTAGALARLDLGPAGLGPEIRRGVEQALGGELRSVEARTVGRRDVGWLPAAVVGIDETAEDGAELGAELARRLGSPTAVTLGPERVAVAAIRPSTGDVEDLAVFVPRAVASRVTGATVPNVLRLFLRAGVTPRAAEARLAAAGLAAAVIRHDRGEVADRESQHVLARHRRTALVVLAAVAALCLPARRARRRGRAAARDRHPGRGRCVARRRGGDDRLALRGRGARRRPRRYGRGRPDGGGPGRERSRLARA